MSDKNHIKPIVLALGIISLLLCTFTTVIADQHAETEEAAETTNEAETTEEASEGDAPVQLESLVVVGTRKTAFRLRFSSTDRYCVKRCF